MAILHQSDLSSWIRCPHAFSLDRAGLPRRQSSALSYGSVMHYCLEQFERLRHTEGVTYAEATTAAVETFVHFWHPANIETICPRVDLWLPRQGYGEMRARGIEAITSYCGLMKYDDTELLATEFGFQVPVEGTWDDDLGEPHILAGSIDRLGVRHYSGRPAVAVDDYKTGKEYKYLRQNLQFTAYCYATTKPEFWQGWRGEDGFGADRGAELYQRFATAGRRGTWINMRTVKMQDAGWRGPNDYVRLAVAIEQLNASIKADIYPLSLSGEHCHFCEFKDHACAGVGVPDNNHGAPTR